MYIKLNVKKKTKGEVVMSKDDFTFKVNGNRLSRARFHFLKKKKETDTVKDDFTYNVLLHDDPILQKKFNAPIFTNLNLKEPINTKKHILIHFKSFQWMDDYYLCTWSVLFRCGTKRSQELSVSNLLLFLPGLLLDLPAVCTPGVGVPAGTPTLKPESDWYGV